MGRTRHRQARLVLGWDGVQGKEHKVGNQADGGR